MQKVEIKIVPTSEVSQIDLNFALNVYKRFKEYAHIKLSERLLDLQEFPFRTTTFGRQYLADAILQAGLRENDRVIVLTSADIYTGVTNYIFGLATLGSAIISSARINPSFWKGMEEITNYSIEGRVFFEKQYTKVLIHELGHTIGLPHCDRWDCVMHYSNSPIELYKKCEDFCECCRKKFISAFPS